MIESITYTIEEILPKLHLQQRNSSPRPRGLEHISKEELQRIFEPVRKLLEEMDSIAFLNLIQCRQGCDGPTIGNGMNVEPIHTKITPPRKGIRYLHIIEKPHRYNIGMFIFPPHERIPLHDHPGECTIDCDYFCFS